MIYSYIVNGINFGKLNISNRPHRVRRDLIADSLRSLREICTLVFSEIYPVQSIKAAIAGLLLFKSKLH